MGKPGVIARWALATLVVAGGGTACGPRAAIPPRIPLSTLAPVSELDRAIALANAPVLYLQPDETFRLSRVVAVVHPNRAIIGYHLLWEDDAHGAWLPFTTATDEEIVWVGLDSTGTAAELWTYWHGSVLHTPWPRGTRPEIDVQWGKHGSLPRGMEPGDLPALKSLPAFYALAWLLPDLWLGALERPGPLCFCASYRRYRTFSDQLPLAGRLDAVVRAADPDATLRAVFGDRYSKKRPWPE